MARGGISAVIAALFAATMAMSVASIALIVVAWDAQPFFEAWGFRGFGVAIGLAFTSVGALIARRHPRNVVGWLFAIGGPVGALQALAEEWSYYAILHRTGLPGGDWAAWMVQWMWVPAMSMLVVYAPLLFPDGRFASRGGRRVAILGAPLIAIASAVPALATGTIAELAENPVGILPISTEDSESVFGLLVLTVGAAQWQFIRRYRRSHGVQREQIRWVVFAAAVTGAALILNLVLLPFITAGPMVELLEMAVLAGVVGIAVAAGIGILKHRLYDIDVVISRTIVLAGLTAFVTLGYVAIVGGVGLVVQQTDRPNHLLSVGAATAVALSFQPVRERLRRAAHRLVYGERLEPYEVLAEVARAAEAGQTTDAVLGRLSQLIAEGTGATSVAVWLRVGDQLRAAGRWPSTTDDLPSTPISAGVDALPGDRAQAVLHDGDVLGAITVTTSRADPLTTSEEQLIADVARHAGVVLRNLRLTTELRQRVEELRTSRQRLVAVQDEERRRLERDLHDGAQQQLVALKVHVKLAERVAEREGAPDTVAALEPVTTGLGDAIEQLRQLAHGIYPPRLAADGLAAALTSHVARAPVPTTVAGDVGRYDREVEAAVYFCCLEALQNVAKYAEASSASIELEADDAALRFVVRDDGRGFDTASVNGGMGLQNMQDRLDALGGVLQIASAPGDGTRVTGALPLEPPKAGPQKRT